MSEKQHIDHKTSINLRWLHRGRRPAGTADLLEEAVQEIVRPPEGRIFVWAGAEARTARALKTYWQSAWSLDANQMQVANYWRQGASAEE